MEQLKTVGDYLRARREERGLSPGQVAVQLGVGESTIYRIEGGRSDARAGLLLRFAALVGADGNELVRRYTDQTCEVGA